MRACAPQWGHVFNSSSANQDFTSARLGGGGATPGIFGLEGEQNKGAPTAPRKSLRILHKTADLSGVIHSIGLGPNGPSLPISLNDALVRVWSRSPILAADVRWQRRILSRARGARNKRIRRPSSSFSRAVEMRASARQGAETDEWAPTGASTETQLPLVLEPQTNPT
jgi:hypothetical protein